MFYSIFQSLCFSKGVKPGRVADEIGINRGTVTSWKKRGYTPRAEVLQRIADYFGVSIDYLLGKASEPFLAESDCKTIGDRITTIRLSKGLTLHEVSSRCNIAEAKIQKYESGQVVPNAEVMDRIASALEVPVAALMGYVFTGKENGKDIYEPSRDTIDVVIDEKKPTPVSEDGLSAEQLELVRLFESAPPALRAAALAVLRSAEGQDKVPGGASKAE